MAATALTGVTVSSTLSQGGFHQLLTVVAFIGSSGVGASTAANGPNGAAAASIITTRAGSLIYGVGEDWDRAVARAVGPGQAIVSEWVDTGTGTSFWVQDQTSPAGASGSAVNIADIAPTSDQWDLVIVEVKAT